MTVERVYLHPECLAVLFMYQGDPGWDEHVPSICSRCVKHGQTADARKTELLNGLFGRTGQFRGNL